MVERKYVDVNVFVYWLGKHPKFGEKAREWIEKIEAGSRGEYITSALTLYELAVILSGLTGTTLKDTGLIPTIVKAVTSLTGLEVTSLEVRDYLKALELMEEYKLDYEDSIHLTVALRAGAKKIISNDRDFDKTPFRREF
ncbi:MAG: type II toxin-antitoxin system VapC family toxin [Thermoproteales archaeon]|nr:type II toxin-antitoxin system VapC family toxin [Thermoproteales archaeon]